MAVTIGGWSGLGPRAQYGTSLSALSGFVIDAADHAFAYRFIAQKTSAITHVDVLLACTGNTSGCTFTISIQADNAGIPSGTVLGAGANAKVTFAGPASTSTFWWAGGGTDPLALGESSGSLVKGDFYWVVVKETGVNPDASNYIQVYRTYTNCFVLDGVKMDDGSAAWTHATAITGSGVFVVKDAGGDYYGLPQMVASSGAMPSASHIYDNNRQGIRYKVGSQHTLAGFYGTLGKAGSPTDLHVKVYEGTTLKATETVLATQVSSGNPMIVSLSTPIVLAADTDIYLIFVQAGTDETDGGDNSNDYSIYCYTVHSTYILSMKVTGQIQCVYGTDTDPTALTVHTDNYFPYINPYITEPTAGLDCAAGGGGVNMPRTRIGH